MYLRPLQRDDLPQLLEIRNDPSTRQFLGTNKEFSIEECQEWFDKTNPEWLSVIYEEKFIGYARIHDRAPESIWIGCDIHPKYRGLGLGILALTLLIEKFKNEGMSIIFLEVFSKNERAKHIYNKLGFKQTSIRILNGEEYLKMELRL